MKLGPYEVVSQIGRGGAGLVLRVRAPDGRDLALKVLASGTSPEVRARFERERRLLASFGEADGFVPLLDVVETPNGSGLVMPYVAGGTLRARLEDGKLGVDATVTLGRALASALGKAHSRGVIHRDLKPENVLFARTGDVARPLVADLGLAKHFRKDVIGASQSVRLSSDGALLGTAGYMSPEQLEDATTAGPPCDVFAIGAMLYECLAGKRAFPGETALEVLKRTQACRPDPLREARPDAPAWLLAAIDHCLQRDPARRPPDGAALEAALQPGAALPAPRRTLHAAPFVRGLIAIAFLIALASIVALAVREPRPTLDPALAPSPVAPVASRAGAPSPAEQLVARARVDLGAWRLHASIAAARSATLLDPGLGAAWLVLGEAQTVRHSRDALDALGRAIELAPGDPRPLLLRARIRRELRDRAGAQEDAARALALDARSAAAHVELARLALLRVDVPAARTHIAEALELEPRNAGAYEVRGAARFMEADYGGSDDVDRAVALDPSLPCSWLPRRGFLEVAPGGDMLMLALGQYKHTPREPAWAAALRASIESDPRRSIVESERALSLDSRSALAWTFHARNLAALGRDEQSTRNAFERALDLDPRATRALIERSHWRRRHGDARAALSDVERAIELDAADTGALIARAWAHAELFDLDSAIRDIEAALPAIDGDFRGSMAAVAEQLRRVRDRGEVVWLEDEHPRARLNDEGRDRWRWVESGPAPRSGRRALASDRAPELHEVIYTDLEAPLAIKPGDRLFVWVWLDPEDPPTQVELQWHDRGAGWEHRASWGSDEIERKHPTKTPPVAKGPLPPPGEWVRLEVAAAEVGLAGKIVHGFAFSLHGGRAAFDGAGAR